MKTMLLIGVVCVGVMGALLAGCDRPSEAAAGGTKVVATTTMIADLVRQIGGDRVELQVLMGPGVDPHAYKPSTADMSALARANRIFYNGLHLEGKMVELFEERLKSRAVAVTRDMPRESLLPWSEGESGAYDPHVWFNVRLWMSAARTVARELAAMDPAGAEVYSKRLAEVLERMKTLDAYVHQQAQSVASERRMLITSHDAFNYFGRAYGFEVRGVQGISTESEAGVASIRSVVQQVLARRLPAIFVESSVSPQTIQRVRDDCAAHGNAVTIGGELYSDAMGTPGEHPPYPVETYDGMVRYNIDTIVRALK